MNKKVPQINKSKISNHDLLQGKPLPILSLLSVIGALYSVHGEHYTFKKLGHAVFSSDLAHLSVPINITQLAPLMTHAQYLTQHLHTQAKTHGNQAGSFLYSLATYANENFLSIHAKYENILYFYTRHVSRNYIEYSSTPQSVYNNFILRRKNVGDILPTTTASPSANPSANDVSNIGKNPLIQVNMIPSIWNFITHPQAPRPPQAPKGSLALLQPVC